MQIQDELIRRTYVPRAIRKKEIPNDGGTKVRVLSIPAIRDRVVQGALKLILEPIFEPDFQPGSYGYRPKRTAHQAVNCVAQGFCVARRGSSVWTSRSRRCGYPNTCSSSPPSPRASMTIRSTPPLRRWRGSKPACGATAWACFCGLSKKPKSGGKVVKVARSLARNLACTS